MSFHGIEMRMKQLEEYLHNRFDSSSEHASEVEYQLTERIRELENDVKELKNSLKVTKNTDEKNSKFAKEEIIKYVEEKLTKNIEEKIQGRKIQV